MVSPFVMLQGQHVAWGSRRVYCVFPLCHVTGPACSVGIQEGILSLCHVTGPACSVGIQEGILSLCHVTGPACSVGIQEGILWFQIPPLPCYKASM